MGLSKLNFHKFKHNFRDTSGGGGAGSGDGGGGGGDDDNDDGDMRGKVYEYAYDAIFAM